MLRVYISYDPADAAYLQTLLRWLRPLEQKYHLNIWHLPLAKGGEKQPYYWDDMLNRLEKAHLYLFLTSAHSAKNERVHKEELPRALKRQAQLGPSLVQLYRIPLPGATYGAALQNVPLLGTAKQIEDWRSDLIGYELLTKDIERVIRELSLNWVEEKHRTGSMLLPDSRMPRAKKVSLKPIPGWLSVAFVSAILYITTSLYFEECAPRRYHGISPNATPPYSAPPRPYMRENPIVAPQPVPPRPE